MASSATYGFLVPDAPQDATNLAAQARIRDLINGFMASQAVHAAVQIGLADAMHEKGPLDPGALAEATATHAPSLHRLLRALAAVGVVDEAEDGRFALTLPGALLRSDAPGGLGGLAKLFCGDLHWRGWGGILHSIRTGESVVPTVFGMAQFDYLAAHRDEAASFNEGQAALTRLVGAALVAAWDFSGTTTIADIGGGIVSVAKTTFCSRSGRGATIDGGVGASLGAFDRQRCLG